MYNLFISTLEWLLAVLIIILYPLILAVGYFRDKSGFRLWWNKDLSPMYDYQKRKIHFYGISILWVSVGINVWRRN